MVKVLLKHFIYEKCIDILFNQITLNFSEVKRERLEAKLRNRIDELMKHMDLLGSRYPHIKAFVDPVQHTENSVCREDLKYFKHNLLNAMKVPPRND